MKVYKCNNVQNDNINDSKSKCYAQNTNFKGLGSWLINLAGSTTQGLQNGGFAATFLVQDTLGMTVPRVGAAFLRDSEVTGQLNTQEGFEVLGREGSTVPLMMLVAPIVFTIACLFGKSASVNSQLIKRYGNLLKQFVKDSRFDKNLLRDSEKFKEMFYKHNIEEILRNTVGKDNVTEDAVKYIMEQLAHYEKIPSNVTLKKFFGKKKYRKECISNIVDYINNIKYTKSSELNMLDKVKLGSETDKLATFSTRDAIEAMIKYSDDAIVHNKNLATLDEIAAEDIKNVSIVKRWTTNIISLVATVGVLSVLPKLYLKNDVAPGARTAQLLKEKEQAENNKNEQQNGAVNFKGKPKSSSIISKIGAFIAKHTKNPKITSEFEYNGFNFTNTLMVLLVLGGVTPPRIKREIQRAQVDENGKKDYSAVYETLIRDIPSILIPVYAIPLLTRFAISAYESNTGFVLIDKDRTKSKWKSFVDLINPYSDAHVLTNREIDALYNNITTKEKMINFCEYINKNNGDLHKIISKSVSAEELLGKTEINMTNLAKLTKKDRNAKIIDYFKNLKMDKEVADKFITKLMRNAGTAKTNKIYASARGLNSIPTVIATLMISPYLLGWVIPRLTYANTRRLHAKAEKEKQQNKLSKQA